jgi:hypothetical protein
MSFSSTLRPFLLAAGLVLFAYLLVRLGPAAVLEMLSRIGWEAFAIAGIYAVYQFFRAAALAACVVGAPRLSLSDALWIRLSGEAVQFLTFTGPFLAEPAKALLLKTRGLTAAGGFATTLAEYFASLFVGAAMSIAALGWLLNAGVLEGGYRTTAVVIVVALSAFLAAGAWAIGARFYLLGTILKGLAALPGLRRRLNPDIAAVHRMEDLLLAVMHDRPARFAWICGLETAAQAAHVFELYWILAALSLAVGPWMTFIIEGATKFIGFAFFFIPGQVGTSEGAHAVIFELVGLAPAAGFTVPFVRRIRSVVVAAVGLAALALLTRRHAPSP